MSNATWSVGGRLPRRASQAAWVRPGFERRNALTLALLAYGFGELIKGKGIIAAFVAGLMLGVQQNRIGEHVEQFGEAKGTLLSYLIFMLFGAVIVSQAITHCYGPAFLYAFLSLTAIAMIPVCIALLGSGLRADDNPARLVRAAGYYIGAVSSYRYRRNRH